MVRHYVELLRHHRKWLIAIVGFSTLLAATGSCVRLSMSPKYTAAASVAVLPTEAEYSFGRESSAGPRSTARGLTSTYIEYLKSRPVVEAALEKIGPKMTSGGSARGQGWIAGLVRGFGGWAQRTYRKLDSGRYVAPDAKEAALQKLTEAIDLTTVADSYVLRVEVSLPDPEIAAAAANALAEAYVERVSSQLATSVGQIGGFLQQQISVREAELKALSARQEQLRTGVGTASLEAEQSRLLSTREIERQRLTDAQAELQSAEAELAVLGSQNIAQSGRSVTELATTRAVSTARRDAALKNLELRRNSLAQISTTLEVLRSKEEPLAAVDRQIETVKQGLAELHTRLLATNLSRSSAMTQIRVIDPAVAPVYPSSPHVVEETLLGVAVGILVSLMLVVLLDTVSERVRTTVDLERIVGRRALGALPRRLVEQVTGVSSWDEGKLRVKLRALGAALERGLTVVGAFDARAIQITGFAEERDVTGAAVLIAAALASHGKQVVCALPSGVPPPHVPRAAVGTRLHFAGDGTEDEAVRAIRIECLSPVSAELSLAAAAGRSPALLCIVPAGSTPEGVVRDFDEVALSAAFPALSFALLEA